LQTTFEQKQVTSGIAIEFGDGLWASHHLASFNPLKGEHEKAATTEGRLEKRSLLAATGLIYPEKQL
jgi:hypothetical protein